MYTLLSHNFSQCDFDSALIRNEHQHNNLKKIASPSIFHFYICYPPVISWDMWNYLRKQLRDKNVIYHFSNFAFGFLLFLFSWNRYLSRKKMQSTYVILADSESNVFSRINSSTRNVLIRWEHIHHISLTTYIQIKNTIPYNKE